MIYEKESEQTNKQIKKYWNGKRAFYLSEILCRVRYMCGPLSINIFNDRGIHP